MPELPEVETVRRGLEKHIVGKRIVDILLDSSPKQLQPSYELVKEGTLGHTITSIERKAKLLFIHLSNQKVLAIHLKMSGRLLIRNQDDSEDKFTRIVIKLNGKKELRFADMRRFGFIKLLTDGVAHSELLKGYGPEPLTKEFTTQELEKILKRTARPIKVVIMDQSQISGVGNIYADESLWCAKIHPLRKANSLTLDEIKALHSCIEKVLEEGIRDGGTSVDSYVDAFGQKGGHAQNLKVFRREGEPCLRDGTIIRKIRVGGRGTHFCPTCQKV